MTARERFIIWGWIAVVVVAGIFPPWAQRGFPAGYHLIFAPPSNRGAIHVDQSRLMIEWIIVTAIAAGLCFAWPRRKATHKENQLRVGYIFEDDGKVRMIHRVDNDWVCFHDLPSAEEEYGMPVADFLEVFKDSTVKGGPAPGTHN